MSPLVELAERRTLDRRIAPTLINFLLWIPALVARCAFDGSANDNSGNKNHATLIGSPTFIAGRYGSAWISMARANTPCCPLAYWHPLPTSRLPCG